VAAGTTALHARRMKDHLGWYSRDYLPHFDQPGLVQAITFRLDDSMPAEVLARWRDELAFLPDEKSKAELQRRIADYLDAGHGECLLRDPRIAKIVEDALLHFDGERYRLLAWVVMPNHVHVLIETREGWPLAGLAHSWKGFVAHEANQLLGREGAFWQREYHDRYIRNEKHLGFARNYIAQNPVKAHLCVNAEDWRWSSMWKGRSGE
jgi:putative DNA methylase